MRERIFSVFSLSKLFLISAMVFPPVSWCQSCYNPLIDSIISGVSLQSISMYNRELSGDTSTIIGGLPYTIISRHRLYPGNAKAAQYIYEKFLGYGLQAEIHRYTETGANVIGKKTGTSFPNQQYIICGHFDDCVGYTPVPDTIPGADDNASGVCAVIEAARILSQYSLKYTILFIALDEEEGTNGGYWGAKAYADTARLRGDSILGVINLDMIAWDSNNDNVFQVTTDTNSIFLADVVLSSASVYAPVLVPLKHLGFYGSDQAAFWYENYKAVAMHEYLSDFNAYYHSANDRYIYLNLPYLTNIVKSAIASLVVLENDFIINFIHDPIQTNGDTASRVASVVIKSNHLIALTNNSKPRLYFKTGTGNYNYMNFYYHNLDTFKFLIPGEPAGSTISYYFAAQDSTGTLVGSLPAGARGVNPPGTTPPPIPFVYRILRQLITCSNSVPRLIGPMQNIRDTINITGNGIIFDYDLNLTINHSHDSSLYIWLERPGSSAIPLSTANGGSGQNYINTTFDDEASMSITQGIPPFAGSFRPESPLSSYDNLPMHGEWVLRIFNYSQTITGQLVSWCLNFDYYDPIGIVNNQIPVKCSLSQNYPNPFNSSTRINFSLVKKSHVRIVVYDILGREVRNLVNDLMDNGKHSVSFNANDISSGMYFYSMFVEGNFYESRKMVLVK
jgi:Peptidase family M28/Secretion system C-terminal sorting domain